MNPLGNWMISTIRAALPILVWSGSLAFFMTNAFFSQTPGVGSACLRIFRDQDGHALDGAKSDRLHGPPHPPAKQLWSVTLCDVDASGLR